MHAAMQAIEERADVALADAAELLAGREQPLLLRGLVADWPLVRLANESTEAALDHIAGFYRGRPVSLFLGETAIDGRFFYNEDLTGFNFMQMEANLADVLRKLREVREQVDAPCLYVGSTAVDQWLPGFVACNPTPVESLAPLVSIWLGNRSRVAAHFDFPDNLACCAIGQRRFTLFPPEQIANLYIGPLDLTPAGQPISLVDFHRPDFACFPRFRLALEAAQTAELAPGDALFIPGMWWHHVEGLAAINALVNCWWSVTPEYMGSPADALTHALLAVKSLPAAQRRAWRSHFDHYVFDPPEDAGAHIPASALGRLGKVDDLSARRLRAELLNKLRQ